jgi:phage gpG-like protein
MTTTFANPLAFASFLTELKIALPTAEHVALERAAVIVETEAKRVLGTHDYGWPPLAASTIASKATGDSPLLETGEMRDSIEHNVDGRSAFVGSDNDKALWHELGTSRVPPRPFLSGALAHKEADVVKAIGEAIAGFLVSGEAGVRRQVTHG